MTRGVIFRSKTTNQIQPDPSRFTEPKWPRLGRFAPGGLGMGHFRETTHFFFSDFWPRSHWRAQRCVSWGDLHMLVKSPEFAASVSCQVIEIEVALGQNSWAWKLVSPNWSECLKIVWMMTSSWRGRMEQVSRLPSSPHSWCPLCYCSYF